MEDKVQTYGTLQEEIISVKEFLDSKTLVSENKLSWKCRVDPKADTYIPVPETLIKSFVEHAFLNDILQHPDGGKIDISIHRTTLGILIMITDNIPLRYQEYSRDRLIGNRLELLDQDIHIYNEKEESSVNYQLLDLAYSDQGKTGTRVLITIVL
jgi:LytS/YehU family sensor histidine kinase